ncbi:MAG: GntR family transcriptional regulator [Bacteroidales bacterium]|nr:MAG: GntR family transcriptional regulator [Bacteroidales bacterium]
MGIDLIQINEKHSIPKYKQIVNAIIKGIDDGKLSKGDHLPSINAICTRRNLSRDTVMMAYNELKAKGVLASFPGKGYYIESTNIETTHRIFLLFDEFNGFKEDLYNSFIKALQGKAAVEIYFHHFNRKVFESLIRENNGKYSSYVIMPTKFENILPLLQEINGKVFILDQISEELKGHFPAVYQNFENDVYNALVSGTEYLKKYKKVIMIYPGGKEPEGQFKGFLRFCKETKTEYELVQDIQYRKLNKGEVFIAISDDHLVKLVKEAKKEEYRLGEDIGLISYNDTSLKEVVGEGITTISTDFKEMGKKLAELVLKKKNVQIENPSSLIIRSSL